MKPYILQRIVRQCLSLIATAGVFYNIFGVDNENVHWKVRENLAFRLGSERYRIGILFTELSSQTEILNKFRDLELYPSNLTGIVESELVQLDKKIELLEKKNLVLKQRIQSLNGPLADAVAILRELVTGEPVESMFEVLIKGDMKRIGEMLSIKHGIDSLWKQYDSLFNFFFINAGITLESTNDHGIFDKEFFEIIKANLGQTADEYYKKLNFLKDQLLDKAAREETEEIYKIERNRILQLIQQDKAEIAYKHIQDLINRFKGKRSCEEMTLLLAKLDLSFGRYTSVLQITSQLPETDSTGTQRLLYRLQSLYALRQFNILLEETRNIDISSFQGRSRNFLIWIIIESVLVTQSSTVEVSSLMSSMTRSSPYALHSIHAFARFLISRNDTSTALSALESALAYPVNTPDDHKARREIELTIAEILYETGNFEDALTKYYSLLNNESMYAQALFGILWCYIMTNQPEKAEFAYRKLINQIPESPLAAEAILILAKRYLEKSHSSWKKLVYLEQEEARLTSLYEKLMKKMELDTNTNQLPIYLNAKDELVSLTSRIKNEPRTTGQQISEYYNQIQKVCDLVIHHYRSGAFQETSFSQQRETLLFYLDSVLIQIGNEGAQIRTQQKLSNVVNDRQKIKSIVENAYTFAAVSLIDKYRWEREFVDNGKLKLNKQLYDIEAHFKQPLDSTTVRSLKIRRDSLNATMNGLLVKEDEIQDWYFNELTSRLSTLVKAGIDYDNYTYFLYHLGELHYAHENRTYVRQYDMYELAFADYETKLKLFRNGSRRELPLEPQMPRLNHDTSIGYFKSIISSNEPSVYMHTAHYSLAWCYNDLSIFDSALYHMEHVAHNYPSSIHAAQAWMYCGEYYFDKGLLDKAIECYHTVMRYPESEWFDEALYKQAWSQYRLSNPEKAISSFLALVDLGTGNVPGKSLLEKESMDYIAISFSETDPTGSKGLERALAFSKKLGDTERGCTILKRLASVYKEQGRYDMARKTLQTLLSTYPNYSENPSVEFDLIALLERDESAQAISARKLDYFKNYSKNSRWAALQKDTATTKRADSLAERMLYGSAIGYHQLAIQKNDPSMYSTALTTYREFIHAYPQSPSTNECHYNLAEIQFSIGNYKESAEEYIAVSKRYPDSKYKETAAWNAIVASQNFLRQESSPQ